MHLSQPTSDQTLCSTTKAYHNRSFAVLLCSSFPRDKRAEEKHLLMSQRSWCLAVLVSPSYRAGIGGRVRGGPVLESYYGRQTLFLHMPFRERFRIGLPTINVVWPWEVWMAKVALCSYEILHWPPHFYARCAACEDTARATAVASHLPLVQCDCSEEDAHTLFFSRCSVAISGYSLSWTMLSVAGDTPATLRNNVFFKMYILINILILIFPSTSLITSVCVKYLFSQLLLYC